MSNLTRLIADLQSVPATNRVLVWGGWDVAYPPNYTDFREYLFTSGELLAALTGQPAPDPATIRVRTTAALNVRRAPVTGDVVTVLAKVAVIDVYEAQTTRGWYTISTGAYAGMYVSETYVEKVT